MYKIFFIFYLNTKSKILLVRRTQNITSIGLFYKEVGILLGSFGRGSYDVLGK